MWLCCVDMMIAATSPVTSFVLVVSPVSLLSLELLLCISLVSTSPIGEPIVLSCHALPLARVNPYQYQEHKLPLVLHHPSADIDNTCVDYLSAEQKIHSQDRGKKR